MVSPVSGLLCPFESQIWLLVTDAHIKWLDVHKASCPSASGTIEKCRERFANFGVPETVVTDNAVCFSWLEFQ